MGVIQKVWIDSERCLCDGFCVDACPEVFHDRGSGVPEVHQLDYSTVDAKLRSAVKLCAYNAIRIEEAREDAPANRQEG